MSDILNKLRDKYNNRTSVLDGLLDCVWDGRKKELLSDIEYAVKAGKSNSIIRLDHSYTIGDYIVNSSELNQKVKLELEKMGFKVEVKSDMFHAGKFYLQVSGWAEDED